MGIRPFRLRLCLSLLAVLWIRGNAAAAEVPPAPTGPVGLTLSTTLPSALPIDEIALAEKLCGDEMRAGKVPFKRGTGHAVKCQVIVKNDVGGGVKWDSEVGTPCGPWHLTADFKSPVAQAKAPLVLTEDPEDPSHGVFTGTLEMIAHLHLTNHETGRIVDLDLHLGFGVAGPWVLESPDDPASLRLFADRKEIDGEIKWFDDCVPAQLWDEYSSVEIVGACGICFDGSSFCTNTEQGCTNSHPTKF